MFGIINTISMQYADMEEFPELNTITFCFEYDHVYGIPWYLVRTLAFHQTYNNLVKEYLDEPAKKLMNTELITRLMINCFHSGIS